MNKLIEIKQTKNSFAKALNIKVEGKHNEMTTHPNSIRRMSPKKDINGDWVTGLTDNEAEEFGKRLKKDLSPTSDYWLDLEILLVNGTKPVTFNLSIIEQHIRYKCAVANKFIAESKEQLNDPDFKINDVFLYVYDPVAELQKENLLQEIKDETTSLIYNMRTLKDKMLPVCAKLNIPFNDNYDAGSFYKILKSYQEALKTPVQYHKLKEVLTTPNEVLYVEYTVSKHLNNNKNINVINGQWVFNNKVVGATKSEVVKYFIKHEDMFMLLIDTE